MTGFVRLIPQMLYFFILLLANIPFQKVMTHSRQPGFSIGALSPVHGLDGELVLASGKKVAMLSAAAAVWKTDSLIQQVDLPLIDVENARWSGDYTKIYVGTGVINLTDTSWEANPVLEKLIQPRPPGLGGLRMKATSWSADGRYVAVLLEWSGPGNDSLKNEPKILLYDLLSDSSPMEIPETSANNIQIAGDKVVVLSSTVSIWSFSGECIARLPETTGIPFRLSVSPGENMLAILDNNWIIRIVDVQKWQVIASWEGMFQDVVALDHALIALDINGILHAACITDQKLQPVGSVETNLLATQLALADSSHLFIMTAGDVSVFSTEFQLDCSIQE